MKSKVNFVFKLSGLTLALLSFLIITLYVTYQLSFDKFHNDYASIYRVNSIRDEDGTLAKYAMVPPAIGPSLKAEFPEIKSFTRISEGDRVLIRYGDHLMRIGGFLQADNSLFDVLTFEFKSGRKNPLDRPGTIVLSSSVARQIFGTGDPIGKLISFPEKGNKTLEVTAVITDFPMNTHLSFKAIAPFNAFENAESMNDNWDISWDGSVFLYLRLHGEANVDLLLEKMQKLVKRNIAKQADASEKRFSLSLQRIDEIYLSPGLKMEFLKKGNGFYVYAFSMLGIFLLVIASINYINLSIADFHNRSKEIGVRKILGARKRQIAFQVTLESLFYCSAALLMGLVILYIIFPRVTALLEPSLKLSMLLNPVSILIVSTTIVFIVVVSATYSAIRLSANSPARDLKKEMIFGRNLSMGRILLVVQFAISFFCISATLVVSRQLNFIGTKDLGFDRTNVVTLLMPDEYPMEKAGVLKDELKALTAVQDVSYSYYLVTGVPYLKDWYKVETGNAMRQLQLNEIFVDHDFFSTMNIEILAGRGFDVRIPADQNTAFIINETAAREFGWSNPIGKRISHGYREATTEGTVIGMTRDFNTRSLREKIEPLVIRLPYDEFPGMSLNVKVRGDLKEALASIKSVYEKVLPGYLMEHRLVEDIYENQYLEERKALEVLLFGTWIVLLIAAFGIFSLSLFMSMKRMKEFGIRKVLGATIMQIAFLHVSYFLRIAIIASAIALPISYRLTSRWLNGFAFRIEPGFITYLAVALILSLMIILTAAYSTLKAGRMNPVDALKLE